MPRGPHGPSELAASVYSAPPPPCMGCCEYYNSCRDKLRACQAFYGYVHQKPGTSRLLVRHADDLPNRYWYDVLFNSRLRYRGQAYSKS